MKGQALWIDLDGAHNVRDLGGLPATSGGVTRDGVLLRADALDALTAADVDRLVEGLGLAHVVDLRSHAERIQRGRGPLGQVPMTYSELEVVDERDLERRRVTRLALFESGSDPATIMSLGYVELLELGSSAFVAALARIVAPAGAPVLVHCAAGKDRTGVLVALLLDAAGVDRAAIVGDYAATQDRMAPIVARLRSATAYQEMAEQIPAFVFEARAETMAMFLAELDERWGGAAGYFEANGAPVDHISQWQSMLIA
jgi:protein tyrosine/serine phosphatase